MRASGLQGEAETLLHGHAWHGDGRPIRRLVRQGHDVNVRDDAGESPLHGACAWGQRTTVRLLLALGADPTITSTDGARMTPLHWAASHGNAGVVRALLRAGADRHARDAQGNTPAMRARARGRTKIADLLEP